MAAKKQNSAKKRKPFSINVGMIIFLIIFLYIVFSVHSYFTREQIRFYEVVEGSLVRQKSYTGIVLREEKAVNAESSGYIHFYIQEGRRVAANSSVYTIDETGALEKYLTEHPELTQEFGKEELSALRYQLSAFSRHFRDRSFSELYNLKSELDTSVMEYSGMGDAGKLETALSQMNISYRQVRSPEAGVLSYTVDGYETLGEEQIEAGLFHNESYQKRTTRPGSLVEGGTPVYKLITSPEWSLVFPLSEEDRAKYQDVKRLKIHFLNSGETTEAELRLFTGKDRQLYGRLLLHSFMERYASARYLDFEIVTSDRSGLKIPLSAVTEKEFYVIPKDFLRIQDGAAGFLRQTLRDGNAVSEFVETEIYRIDEQFCYLNIPANPENTSSLKTGDVLRKDSGSQSYSVGPTKPLQGVYNINKGYCIFRQVIPMEQNETYMIVEPNTDYGISVYDHIVLNASMVEEGELIYQ
ncbi:hypothetical protein HW273_06965 [Oribacterium sp. oral taxon 102]|uniref:HlyD family efflux transporter periplasmic adaptor subunit n=1 Tax=Oribacterium sp. oral taxon 102 TaxID=671214 RepID=UPI0015BBF953|nr:HlyD family efflux transporter periplasmic adaptor subunit [Oribacterium sp. oral taxon 102]NWO21635.1 hypothetical protein [Oribacterium sp. oral taxon 102]